MRQQVRLNVLIPVAVLGLLGAGFGAWAMGGAPGPTAAPTPVVTTTAETPAAPAPAKPKPGSVTPEAWANGADALCEQAQIAAHDPGKPVARGVLLASLASVNGAFKTVNAGLAALGMPEGDEARVLELRTLNARTAKAFREAHAALRRGNAERAQAILRAAEPRLGAPAKLYRQLGAEVCAGDAETYLALARSTDSLTWMLLHHRAVVVLLYSPGSTVDSKAVVEARAAASDARVGFVAVNAKREQQVAALAVDYEVLDTPTVLVFTRGPKLRSHFPGLVDRTTVLQAVTNAGR